jgi:methyl-accepting chemotaxis protein
MHQHKRRRQWLVYKKVQYKYAVLTVALLVLYTLILLAAIFVPSFVLFVSDGIPPSARAEAANALLLLNRFMWPGIAAVILLFGMVSIFITHKVAGPLFVIERMIRHISEGNFSARIKLRRGDDLAEFEQSMNLMAENLENSLSALRERGKNLLALVRDLSPEHASEKHTKALAEAKEIEKILAQYTFGKKEKRTD